MARSGKRQPRVSDRCDVCMEARLSVREGGRYICEICLDGNPPLDHPARMKV
ncbi:MAG: hypothetical protein SVU88_03305 [Candidatus Nanohaloarchaea archaeon]|nr:hypothetical protein [Candidatus Nanohaloarchaea archaeon]